MFAKDKIWLSETSGFYFNTFLISVTLSKQALSFIVLTMCEVWFHVFYTK